MADAVEPVPSDADAPAGVTYLDHTADVGYVARGRDLKEAFARAAAGLFAVLADLDQVRPVEEREVAVTADNAESLLVEWLAELHYLYEADGLLLSRFDIHEFSPTALRATVAGERADPSRHELKVLVKGITYYGLEVHDAPGDAWVQVVLDI